MSGHIVPARVYLLVYAALMAGTLLTVLVAYFDLGALNTVVAMGVAGAKAVLVVLFFMHVRYSARLNWVVAAGGVFWLGILFALTFSDYVTRAWRTFG